jgi:hypothetical protein
VVDKKEKKKEKEEARKLPDIFTYNTITTISSPV